MDELFRTEKISFNYRKNYPALNEVSVSFGRGELVVVLGNNGAGKSTFFLCCNGVLRPQSGSLFLEGREIGRSKQDISRQRQAVGLVFQDPDSQIIAGSVESEVSFGPMNLRLALAEVVSRVDQALAQMNITRYRDYAPQYLSGGEKKRVTIADILAMQPQMILLDEPTASLDPENAEALEEVLLELNRQGITVVISTHDVNFAYRVAERAIVFADGSIIADAPAAEVFASAEILERAGLRKPLLYETWQSLCLVYPRLATRPAPRAIEELRRIIESLG